MPGPAYYSGLMNMAKNEDWIVPFVYQMDNGDGTFTPIDLTGSILTMEIRRQEEDHEVLVSVWSPDGGIVINDATAGTFTIIIGRDAMVQMAPGDYVSDIVREMTNGFQERLWEGTATVVQGTTR
jgi:hypothetical protein